MDDNERRITDLCDTPIDVRALLTLRTVMYTEPYSAIEGMKVIPTQFASVKKNVFVALLELMDAICSGLDFEKKGRIILEYDPQDARFVVATFQEAADVDIGSDHEAVPRFLLRRGDR